jgi:hypothetical protein
MPTKFNSIYARGDPYKYQYTATEKSTKKIGVPELVNATSPPTTMRRIPHVR